jgi:hypothetical protein
VRLAYKFLAAGATSPFTGFRWPGVGEWVSARPGREPAWVFACRRGDLPYWLERELWLVELEGPVREARHQISAPRARLASRVHGWNDELRHDYAAACAFHARELALTRLPAELALRIRELSGLSGIAAALDAAPDSSTIGGFLRDVAAIAPRDAAAASYVAAILAAAVGGDQASFEAEREWQARWLSERLGLGEG